MGLLDKNMGEIDRLVRIVVGVALLAGGLLYVQAPWSYLMLLVGLVFTVTSLLGTCPAYNLIGMDTRGKKAPATKKR